MPADHLSSVFGALADPTRRAILARLRQGDASVQEITAPFGLSQPAVSRHLKVLEAAGLVSRHRQATTRLSHLEAEPLREATTWLASYQAYWDESFDRLDVVLRSLTDAGDPTSNHLNRRENGANVNARRLADATDDSDPADESTRSGRSGQRPPITPEGS